MNLKRKNIIASLATFSVALCIVIIVPNVVLIGHIDDLESQNAVRSISRISGIMETQTENLATHCADWATWDDTYRFIQDRNQSYIDSNLVDETFKMLGLDFILYFDADGSELFSKSYDRENEAAQPAPGYLAPGLEEQDLLMHGRAPGQSGSGIIVLEEEPFLVSAYPILDSRENGPVMGTLVFGRHLGSAEIANLSEMANLPIELYPFSSTNLPETLERAKPRLTGDEPVYIYEYDDSIMAGVTVLRDINGNPALIAAAELPRSDYAFLRNFGRYFMVGLIIIASISLTLEVILTRRWLLTPLADLDSGISQIRLDGSPDMRLPVTGKDEIAHVTRSVNEMLDALQGTRQALAESVEKYQDIFDNAHDMIQSVDTQGKLLYTNPAWRNTLGYNEEEIKSLNLFDIIHPDEQENCRKKFMQVLSGTEFQTLETAFITKDGQKVWVIGSASCRFIDGKPMYTRGIFHDVSEVRQARIILQEMYDTEKKLREELQAEIRRRIDYVRVVTHELKNGLTSLMASSSMLTEIVEKEPVKSLAKNIQRGTEHLHKRIQEMLDMARIEMGTISIQPRPIDAGRVLKGIAEDVTALAESRGQTVAREIPEALPRVMADPDRLWQICLNLLDNASRHTSRGGTITIGAEEDGEFLRVFVRDTGKGIEPERLPGIFHLYGKTEPGKDHISGLGLGLALCKSFVELQHGKIWAESQVGEGSSFYFTIPVALKEDFSTAVNE